MQSSKGHLKKTLDGTDTDMMILEDTFRYGGMRSISSSKHNIDISKALHYSKNNNNCLLGQSIKN